MENYRKALFNLAQEQIKETARTQMWVENLTRSFQGGLQLYRLARQVSGIDGLKDADLLTTFFTSEAAQMLLDMPNSFWLWKVIRGAVLNHRGPAGETIGKEAVESAVCDERNVLAAIVDLRKDIDELSPDQAAFWQAAGAILVDITKGKTTRVRNPIFRKP